MSRFMQRAAVGIGRVVARLPLMSKFLNYLSPPTMKLEPKGPEAAALRAEVHREMAVAATPPPEAPLQPAGRADALKAMILVLTG